VAEKQISLPQTIGEHVVELRARLKWFALFFTLGAGLGYALHDQFIELLKRPLHEKLYYTSPAGGFNFVMKICVVFGLVFALPALVYNVISFIRPAFTKELKKSTVRLVSLLSLVLALGGAVFAFYVVVPGSLRFFAHFTEGVQPLLSATDYLSFIVKFVKSFMVIFQAPLIILFIDRIKPLTPGKLLSLERYVIVGSLAAALILPFTYDPVTQFLIAIPIIALYNLSIVFVAISHARRKRQARSARQVTPPVVHRQPATPRPQPVRVPRPVAAQPTMSPVHRRPAVAQARQQQRPAVRPQRKVMDIMPRDRPVQYTSPMPAPDIG
jgi:sec-independent protein translocase protein TatC